MKTKIEISLVPNNALAEGFDYNALAVNIDAELAKLQSEVELSCHRKDVPAPSGAQGGPEIIEWLLNIALDPNASFVYARALLFALNQLLDGGKKEEEEKGMNKEEPEEDKKEPEAKDKEEKAPIKVKFGKKHILLPATTLAIREFLKELEKNSDG